jgi:hypothetical protein
MQTQAVAFTFNTVYPAQHAPTTLIWRQNLIDAQIYMANSHLLVSVVILLKDILLR